MAMQPGYDGELGVVKVFTDAERKEILGQRRFALPMDLPLARSSAGDGAQSAPTPLESAPTPLESAPTPLESAPAPLESAPAPLESAPAPLESAPAPLESAPAQFSDVAPFPLNEMQLGVVRIGTKPVVVSAGPGTGKTRTLTERIVH